MEKKDKIDCDSRAFAFTNVSSLNNKRRLQKCMFRMIYILSLLELFFDKFVIKSGINNV